MRRLGVGSALALVASWLPLVATPPVPVEAAPDDVIAIVLEGTGHGHGRGMSQWGAYGWAVDGGKSWGWILDHYYGGTVSGTVATGERIRVRLLGHDGAGTVGVISHGPGVTWGATTATSMYAAEVAPNTFDLYSSSTVACPSASALTVPDGPLSYAPSTYRADVERMQRFLDQYFDSSIGVDGYFGPQTQSILTAWQQSQSLPADGIWNGDDATRAREIIAAGGQTAWTPVATAVPGPIVFGSANADDPAASAATVLGLCNGGSVTHYRGALEVWDTSAGNRVVNDALVEAYLRGVVPKEISASWADAGGGNGVNAVRAQAVAARSFGLQQSRYSYAATCDSMSCQVYGGAATRGSATGSPSFVEDARTDAAIAATAGVVRRWPSGGLVSTEFSASNGPRTAGGAFTPVDDIGGDNTTRNPNHRWTRILDADALAAQYGLGRITGATMVEAASATYRQFDGIWFNDIVLTGTNGTFRQQAWDFRNAHGLLSPGFTVRVVTENTTATSFGLIGDSVGVSIAGSSSAELQRVTDGTFTSRSIDVVEGRCTQKLSCPGTSGVQAAASLPFGLDTVVVELGYNDWPPTFAADIDAMMNALTARGVKRVAWVNMAEIRAGSGGGSYYAQANQALRDATSRWPTLTVLDWNAATDHGERPRWFADAVHLTTTGQAEFALWIRAQVLGLDPTHWLAPPKKIVLPVAGVGLTSPQGASLSVPASARAVALNITGVDPAGDGYATAWPCDSPRPETSNLNFRTGDVVANSVIAPVAPDGTVCFYSSTGTHLLVDISGWFPTDGPAPTFTSITPYRFVDTRAGSKVGPAAPLRVPLGGAALPQPGGGSATVPADAAAVAVTLTAVDTAAAGFATVWPCSSPRPNASHLNFGAGDTVPNMVVAPLDENGELCIHLDKAAHVLVDVAGWFPAGDGAFRAAIPTRVVDTRAAARVQPAAPLVVPVHGAFLATSSGPVVVPDSAGAAALNLTIVGASEPGYGTVWPCGSPQPVTSNVNFGVDSDVANGVIAPIGAGGAICVFTSTAAHVLVDVTGWFPGGSDPSFVGSVPLRLVDTRNAIGPAPS